MNAQRLHDASRSLRLVRRDLDTLIAPELGTATAQSALSMIGKLLDMVASELEPDQGVDTAAATAADLLGQVQTVAATGGDAGFALWQACDALAAIRAARDAGSADSAWDAAYLESGAGSRSKDAPRTAQREFSAAELAAYLQHHGRVARAVSVTRLERLPGGFSKGTYLVELLDFGNASSGAQSWVLRRDLSFTPLQTRVVDEFPLLAALHAQGLPVPEPLWCEPDAAHLGAPLIAVRRVGGSGDMAYWAQDREAARGVALSAACLLARIHAVPLAGLPPLQTDAPGSSGDTPGEALAHVAAFWQQVRIEPDPLVELVFNWLRGHAPRADRRTLVHGDYGLHNLLVEHGSVSAILDWEFAHAGDPREDLAYARPFVEKVLPWSEFVQEYENAGGGASDDQALRFYTVLGTLRNALGCMKVLHALRHGDAGIDSKFVYAGRSYAQQMLRAAAQLTGALADTHAS